MKPGDRCHLNALAFDAFCRDIKRVGGKVTVGLSSNALAADGQPPNDLVINVAVVGHQISKRVVGRIADAIVELRDKLGLAAP